MTLWGNEDPPVGPCECDVLLFVKQPSGHPHRPRNNLVVSLRRRVRLQFKPCAGCEHGLFFTCPALPFARKDVVYVGYSHSLLKHQLQNPHTHTNHLPHLATDVTLIRLTPRPHASPSRLALTPRPRPRPRQRAAASRDGGATCPRAQTHRPRTATAHRRGRRSECTLRPAA